MPVSDIYVCSGPHPLVKRLLPSCRQIWLADDGTGCDTFEKLRKWFDLLLEVGPQYGYYPKAAKCILLSKPDRVTQASEVFKGTGIDVQVDGSKDTGVEVVSTGTRHLGAAVGSQEFQKDFVQNKIHVWVDCIKQHAVIAATEPHAAYAAYTRCLQSQWTFLFVQCLHVQTGFSL